MSSPLGEYDGRDILQSKIAIRRAGDGLSEAVAVQPREFHIGDEHFVVLRCEVGAISHKPIKGTDALSMVADFVCQSATIVDASVVESYLREQEELIARARDTAEGKGRLPYEQELRGAHVLGEHRSGLVEGCPLCDEEQALEDQEASE